MNEKLEYAIHVLEREQVSCVIYDGVHVPEVSREMGIKPLISKLRQNKQAFCNCVIADKVIGKAAAFMAILGGVEAVYGDVMSEDAIHVLELYQIPYQYHTLVPYIENRTKTGRCPLEQSVLTVIKPEEAYEKLEVTIQMLMGQKARES